MESKKIQHLRNSSKINRKIVEKVRIDTPTTQIHGHSCSWIDTESSIKTSEVKLI